MCLFNFSYSSAVLGSFLGLNGNSAPQSKGQGGTSQTSQFMFTHRGPHSL